MPDRNSIRNCLSCLGLTIVQRRRNRDVRLLDLPDPPHSAMSELLDRDLSSRSSHLCLEPVLTRAHVHDQGHGEGRGTFHLGPHQGAHGI